jgi:hypothetical protein
MSVRLRLTLPASLHAEPLKDERCRYRDLTALLYGPLVLAGLTHGLQSELTGARDALHETMSPVPAATRAELASLRLPDGALLTTSAASAAARGSAEASGARLSVARLAEPGYAVRRRGGSDAANAATWRLRPVAASSAGAGAGAGAAQAAAQAEEDEPAVALEAFAQPNRFVTPDTDGALALRVPAAAGLPYAFRRRRADGGESLWLESAER